MAATVSAASGPLAACLQPLAGLPPPDLSLPALEPVKNRETYRERPETELEEVRSSWQQWLKQPQQPMLGDSSSTQHTSACDMRCM